MVAGAGADTDAGAEAASGRTGRAFLSEVATRQNGWRMLPCVYVSCGLGWLVSLCCPRWLVYLVLSRVACVPCVPCEARGSRSSCGSTTVRTPAVDVAGTSGEGCTDEEPV